MVAALVYLQPSLTCSMPRYVSILLIARTVFPSRLCLRDRHHCHLCFIVLSRSCAVLLYCIYEYLLLMSCFICPLQRAQRFDLHQYTGGVAIATESPLMRLPARLVRFSLSSLQAAGGRTIFNDSGKGSLHHPSAALSTSLSCCLDNAQRAG